MKKLNFILFGTMLLCLIHSLNASASSAQTTIEDPTTAVITLPPMGDTTYYCSTITCINTSYAINYNPPFAAHIVTVEYSMIGVVWKEGDAQLIVPTLAHVINTCSSYGIFCTDVSHSQASGPFTITYHFTTGIIPEPELPGPGGDD